MLLWQLSLNVGPRRLELAAMLAVSRGVEMLALRSRLAAIATRRERRHGVGLLLRGGRGQRTAARRNGGEAAPEGQHLDAPRRG